MTKPRDISPEEQPFLDAVALKAIAASDWGRSVGFKPLKSRFCGMFYPGDARTVCTRETGHAGDHRARIPNHKSRRNWKIKGWRQN